MYNTLAKCSSELELHNCGKPFPPLKLEAMYVSAFGLLLRQITTQQNL